MKVTFLIDLVAMREAVAEISRIDRWYKIVEHYSRSPKADELVAVSDEILQRYEWEGDALPFDLKPIGVHPSDPFFIICSRSDSGPFWRGVAVAKYGVLLTDRWIWNQVLKYLYVSGMMIYPAGEKITWKHLRLDALLISATASSTGLIWCSFRWLFVDGYWQSIFCLVMSILGWIAVSVRRNTLLEARDREMREISLRGFFSITRC